MSDAIRPPARTGTVWGIGVGPGDPELITLKGARLLAEAPVIAYPAPETGDSFARAIAAPHIPDGRTEIVMAMPMVAERFPAQEVYDRAAAAFADHLAAGRDIAVLCEGDPFFYGSFMYLFARLAEDWPVRVVPGVSSLVACAAALETPLVGRNDVLTVLPAPLDEDRLVAHLTRADAAAIVKPGRHIAKIRRALAAADLAADALYIERATLPHQRILPLDAVDEGQAPYFSMILAHRRGRAWVLA